VCTRKGKKRKMKRKKEVEERKRRKDGKRKASMSKPDTRDTASTHHKTQGQV